MNCPSCSKRINPKSIRCQYCRTILVSKEKFSTIVKKRKEKSLIKEKKDFIKSGRNTLLIVGGINTLPLFVYLSQGDDLSAIIQGTIASIFLGLGLLAMKFPYAALNLAIINLSKILRRHYRKIKNENKGNKHIRLLKDSFLLYNLR